MSIIPSHTIASWILKNIDRLLDSIGLGRYQTIEQVIYFIIILSASFVIGWGLRRAVLVPLRMFVKKHNSAVGNELLRQRTLSKCSHIIPPLVFLGLVPFAFESSAAIHSLIVRCAVVYLIVMIGIALSAVFRFIFLRYNDKQNTKNLPLRGVLNVAVGILWAIVLILSVSVLVQKSPAALLGGLTAFAAVLMLVFKDSILGFVAGIQMSQNDMVRVGDWITVPGTPADGIVEDVSLTTVKVRNFDNTLVTVPPYTLVSGACRNWRQMTESGVRRVKVSLYINPDSVKPVSEALIDDLCQRFSQVKLFVDEMRKTGKTIRYDSGNAPVNGSVESNLGLFRAYLNAWLTHNPMIAPDCDTMVHITSTSPEGICLDIYCFSSTTQWEAYEAVMSAVLEHAMITAPAFALETLSGDQLNVTTRNEHIQQAQAVVADSNAADGAIAASTAQ